MREIVHLQAGQCGNQIGAKVSPKEKFISGKKSFFFEEGRPLNWSVIDFFLNTFSIERFLTQKVGILRGKIG